MLWLILMNCFLMIPSGSTHDQMLLGPDDKLEGEISEEGMNCWFNSFYANDLIINTSCQ